ncbi:MAG: hypothetical protein WC464_02450 [Bdellovibrionales bacterium]
MHGHGGVNRTEALVLEGGVQSYPKRFVDGVMNLDKDDKFVPVGDGLPELPAWPGAKGVSGKKVVGKIIDHSMK